MILLREYWKSQTTAKEFESFWETSLHDGLIRDSALPARSVNLDMALGVTEGLIETLPPFPFAPPPNAIELVFRPDPTIYDGRFANNGWLQEAPKPITKLTWDNTAQLSPATAQRLGLTNGDMVHVVLE